MAGLAVVAVVITAVGGAAAFVHFGGSNGGGTSSAGRSPSPVGPTPSRATPSPSPSSTAPLMSASPGSPTPLASPTPSGSPISSPHEPGFVQTADGLVYYSEDGTAIPVQPVTGLRVELRSGKAQYFAIASNRYGLVSGSYAGEFKPNVTMQQADGSSAQTGGVVVVGPVASRLIADRLAAIKTPADKWVVALPVDIRSATHSVDVAFDRFGLHGWSDTPRVTVKYSGSLPVVNIIPANAGYHVLVEGLGVTRWQVIDPTRLELSTSDIDASHPMNELLVYGTGTPSTRRNVLVDRRVSVGQKMLTASDEVSVSLVVPGSRADMAPDKVLTIGDVPVFVASS